MFRTQACTKVQQPVLTIKGATAAEAGDYTCLVTANPTGANLLSQPATISVISAPAISTQPAAKTVCEGEKVTMNVVATGGTLGYQWKRAGVNISGATDASVEIETDASMNGQLITCVISNNCGTTTSSEAALTVNSKPVITTQPSDMVVVKGSVVTISVSATGGSSYQWKFNGAAIPGATQASYELPSYTESMAGNYVCEVTNSCGMTTSNAARLSTSGREEDALAAGFGLSNAEPTPTNDYAKVNITMPSAAQARVVLHDSFGREVAVLFEGVASENQSVRIDATKLSNGVYTYTLSSGSYSLTRKMVVTK